MSFAELEAICCFCSNASRPLITEDSTAALVRPIRCGMAV